MKENFDGNILSKPGKLTRVRTQEGEAAVEEAIEACRKVKGLRNLIWNKGL
jgi:hypothetical protein